MAEGKILQALHEQLFADPRLTTYAVLDGASCPDLLDALYQHAPEHCCLFTGDLEPDLAAAAPYLVRLVRGEQFTLWTLSRGWHEHWGVFLLSEVPFRPIRLQCRKFLRVHTHDGRPLLFRWYDPRVLSTYLPTCNVGELADFFGPVRAFCVEDEDDPEQLIRYGLRDASLTTERVQLAMVTS